MSCWEPTGENHSDKNLNHTQSEKSPLGDGLRM
ncbi:hypothetical protein PgNI_10881 [Pyricularia grisea]|uniref:Uncharacterized protein n=1 Tax=Pyricularia grisea TaxID=148305 RepID=A0A6P8AXH8_PYRGI|nr:hypothetical protein PgNI_10881 [Pyricularia grisea]TLD06999.1 hypothetical protein PgNI_10881 [Pyricularia grisea]